MKSVLQSMKTKVWKTGGSLVVTIPKDIAALFSITEGSEIEISATSKDELTLRYKRIG